MYLTTVELSKRIRTFLPTNFGRKCCTCIDNITVSFLIHLCEVDSLFWTRYLEKSLFCLGDPRTRFWKRLLSMCFMELWTCLCLDFTVSTTILDDFLKVSKKELLLPEFDLMVSNEKEGVTELVA